MILRESFLQANNYGLHSRILPEEEKTDSYPLSEIENISTPGGNKLIYTFTNVTHFLNTF